EHPGLQTRVKSFRPDGNSFVVINHSGHSSGFMSAPSPDPNGLLWSMPAPLPDDLPRLALWVECATGLELDDRGEIQLLDGAARRDRCTNPARRGGPPPGGLDRLLDPILFGADPTARADRLRARGLWDEAESAYDEAFRARPFNISVQHEKARLFL